MKYVKEAGKFTTEEFSIDETITEIKDVIMIAEAYIKGSPTSKDLNIAYNLLEQAINYLNYIRKKTNKALKYVPEDVQTKEHL